MVGMHGYKSLGMLNSVAKFIVLLAGATEREIAGIGIRRRNKGRSDSLYGVFNSGGG